MAQSTRPRQWELRSLYLLVGECLELGADREAWKQHMMAGLLALLGGQVAVAIEVGRSPAGPGPMGQLTLLDCTDHGWLGASARRVFLDFMRDNQYGLNPLSPPLFGVDRPLPTRTRRQLVQDPDWNGSVFFNDYMRHAGVDELLRFRQRTAERIHLIGLARPNGTAPYAARPQRLLHLFGVEIAPQWGHRLAGVGSPSVQDLAPRLRQVLRCLLEGDAEKEVAARLGLSPNTIHAYVGRLHQYFGASSRGELLAGSRGLWPALLAIDTSRYYPGTKATLSPGSHATS